MKLRLTLMSGLSMLALAASATALADQLAKPAQLVKSTPLLQAPANNAYVLESLAKDQSVTVQGRKRAWYQIQTEQGSQGWVKMLMLRFSAKAKRDSETGVAALWSSATASKTERTVSTGIRGFTEEELRNAVANPQQVKKLDRFVRNKQQALAFAAEGRLKTKAVQVAD